MKDEKILMVANQTPIVKLEELFPNGVVVEDGKIIAIEE